jgi:hypothetical protein
MSATHPVVSRGPYPSVVLLSHDPEDRKPRFEFEYERNPMPS